MPSNQKRRWRRLAQLAGVVLLGGLIWLGLLRAHLVGQTNPIPPDVRLVEAFRTDLNVVLSAGGEIDTAKKTMIECELENMRVGSLGANGSSIIIDLIPEGTHVREGDVICQLDSSDYEELVRQATIQVDRFRADKRKAELNLGAAEIALIEYRDGTLAQLRQNFREQLFLYEADIARQKDRIQWSESMVKNGYLSENQLVLERENLKRSELNLKRVQGESSNLERFVAPIQLRTLEASVEKAQAELSFQDLRVRRREEHLARLERQVELCTIRAPHDGMVIYVNRRNDQPIELGATVRQRMDLFYLPDLSQMEVIASINETVIDRIEVGMLAQVQITGLPEYELQGHIVSISPLPVMPRSWRASREIKNFQARIQLHSIPPDLLPGMTAEVEIQLAEHQDALVIPSTAISIEEGSEVCYVPRADGLERREVAIAPGNDDLLQVVAGLEEGETVVLDPGLLDSEVPVVATTTLPTTSPGLDPQPEPELETASNAEMFTTQ